MSKSCAFYDLGKIGWSICAWQALQMSKSCVFMNWAKQAGAFCAWQTFPMSKLYAFFNHELSKIGQCICVQQASPMSKSYPFFIMNRAKQASAFVSSKSFQCQWYEHFYHEQGKIRQSICTWQASPMSKPYVFFMMNRPKQSFVSGKNYQPCLSFAIKAGAFLCEAPSSFYIVWQVGSWPFIQTYDQAGKACQGETLQLIGLMC